MFLRTLVSGQTNRPLVEDAAGAADRADVAYDVAPVVRNCLVANSSSWNNSLDTRDGVFDFQMLLLLVGLVMLRRFALRTK